MHSPLSARRSVSSAFSSREGGPRWSGTCFRSTPPPTFIAWKKAHCWAWPGCFSLPEEPGRQEPRSLIDDGELSRPALRSERPPCLWVRLSSLTAPACQVGEKNVER